MIRRSFTSGFTIVELLIVVVIIGILASITVVAYNGIQDRARLSKMKSDISTLSKAIRLARESRQMQLVQMTGNGMYGSGGEAAACNAHPAGTDLAALPKTDSCWVAYNKILTEVTTASGVDIRGLIDPWNRPYSVIEDCSNDKIRAFRYPYVNWSSYPGADTDLPRDSYATC